MLTEQNIIDSLFRFVDPSADFRITRSCGSWSNVCGFQLCVYTDIGSYVAFFHDHTRPRDLTYRMIDFVENMEATERGDIQAVSFWHD